jgi:hypothetical protein
MSTELNKALVSAFLTKFDTPEQLRDWCYTYLDFDFPSGHIDPDSNSSPVEWMFEAYTNYRYNRGDETPGYIVLSSRESYKTLTESAFAIIMMAHFGCTIAHMAAIEPQAVKAIEYLETFLIKVKPYLEANARFIESQNKRKVEIVDKEGRKAYVIIIIATMQGANAPHTNIMSIDEVDVMRFPMAYEEAKLIPGMFDGQYPLTIKTSTRKFAFGLMEKEIQNTANSHEKLLRWNILDVTEHCPEERHRPEEPMAERYIHKDLPLRNISPAEYNDLLEEHKQGYSKIEAYAGCASCPLLPVCKMRLANRPKSDKGGLYKTVQFVINQFKKLSPDMAEAQLMCWRPSLMGLIYKRFDETEITGNTYTPTQAYEVFTGERCNKPIAFKTLVEALSNKGIKFKVGLDWGYRHYFALVVSAQMPNGEWWIIDCYAIAELELEDKLKYGKIIVSDYLSVKFYPDNSDPASIKTFRRNKLSCVNFKKDVSAGIEAVRAQILDGLGKRRLKVIKHDRTQVVIDMFRNHHFKLDPAGNPTTEPDDEEFADIGDATRYIGQNLFGKSSVVSPSLPPLGPLPTSNLTNTTYQDWMSQKIRELSQDSTIGRKGTSKGGGVIWDFSGDDPIDE